MASLNVDPYEIAKFDQVAARWWDPNSEFRALHRINPLRLAFVQQQVQVVGKNILDVGCGGGILSEALARAGAEVTGIDLSRKAIQIAKLHLYESKLAINYHAIALEEWVSAHPETSDVVICMELLEHVPDPALLVTQLAKACKPGGSIFFATINRTLQAYANAILAAEYLLQWLPRGTHDYQKFITPAELANWCRRANLTPKKMAGIDYQLLSDTFMLSSNPTVNYLLWAIK